MSLLPTNWSAIGGQTERAASAQRELETYRTRALAAATKAAQVLRLGFGATRAVLSGSLAQGSAVSRRTDANLVRVVDRTRAIAEKAQASVEPDYFDGLALNLHAFYTGVELILESIRAF